MTDKELVDGDLIVSGFIMRTECSHPAEGVVWDSDDDGFNEINCGRWVLFCTKCRSVINEESEDTQKSEH